MKPLFFSALLSLLIINNTSSQAKDVSFCDNLPEGSYKNSCRNLSLTRSQDRHGVYTCTLMAECDTLPHTPQQPISATLTMHEYSFGPDSECKDIAAINGVLVCLTEGDSFEGTYSPSPPPYPTIVR